MVAALLYNIFLITNYVFSFHPIYKRKALITNLEYQHHHKRRDDWNVYLEFLDNGERGKVSDIDYYDKVYIGDTATLFLKRGLFYIPIVKDLNK